MKTSKFEEVFKNRKPVIGMLHLRGESPAEVVEIARGETEVMYDAGLTAETCAEQLSVADGGIVGTYFKENGVTKRPMDPMRVKEFMEALEKGGSF